MDIEQWRRESGERLWRESNVLAQRFVDALRNYDHRYLADGIHGLAILMLAETRRIVREEIERSQEERP